MKIITLKIVAKFKTKRFVISHQKCLSVSPESRQRILNKAGISKAGPQKVNGLIGKEFNQVITVDLVLKCTFSRSLR